MNSQLIGIAGVYYVAAQLSKMGYIALVTTRNTEGIDILVTDLHDTTIGIQVKTRMPKSEEGDNVHFPIISGTFNEIKFEDKIKHPFVFVVIRDDETKYYVLSPNDVIKLCKEDFENYMKNSKHRKPYDDLMKAKHVLGVNLKQLKEYENNWNEINVS